MIINLNHWLAEHGVSPAAIESLEYLGRAILIIVVAVMSDYIAKKGLLSLLRSLVQRTVNHWDDLLVAHHVFDRLSHIMPALVIYFGVSLLFPEHAQTINIVRRFAMVYIIVAGLACLDAFLSAFLAIYSQFKVSYRHPIKGYVQVAKIVTFFLGGILVISTLIEKSPWGLLSLLGGLTAILLLIFKDTILGFIASIQLVSNNMIRQGDWIEMPKYGADGDVIDVSIHTVKVQNWDKTITTIPTYALVSDSFKNWRGMQESGGRRIKRAIYIDMNSVKFCTEEMLSSLKKIAVLKDYIEKKNQEIENYNRENHVDVSQIVNGRRMTNLGTFRAYMAEYLKNHPKIHKEMTFLVRHLAPTAQGIPIEIYIFSNDQNWANYESIQADIFDHMLAVIPEFDLRIFQGPSGLDIRQAIEALQLPR